MSWNGFKLSNNFKANRKKGSLKNPYRGILKKVVAPENIVENEAMNKEVDKAIKRQIFFFFEFRFLYFSQQNHHVEDRNRNQSQNQNIKIFDDIIVVL